jgi:hypothetical protein
MLSPRLQEVKEKIEAKSSSTRTNKEKELLKELEILDQFLTKKSVTHEFRESVSAKADLITSGPGGGCSCCGK